MRVHIEHDWLRPGYSVWFFERRGSRNNVYYPAGKDFAEYWKEVDEGVDTATIEPSLRLRSEALEALLQEAEKVIPASHATERHLSDAIATRDRLLTLVEEGWHA